MAAFPAGAESPAFDAEQSLSHDSGSDLRLPVWRAVGGALGSALLTWVVLVPLAGLQLAVVVGARTSEVGVGSVVVTAVLAALAALIVAAVLRRTARPRARFVASSAVAFVLSLVGPLVSATTTSATLGLGLLHVMVAAAIVPVVASRLPASRAMARGRGAGAV